MAQLTEWQADGRLSADLFIGAPTDYAESLNYDGTQSSEALRQTWIPKAAADLAAATMTYAGAASNVASYDVWSYASTFATQTRHDVKHRLAPARPTTDPTMAALGTGLAALLTVAPHLSAEDVLPLVEGGSQYVEFEPGELIATEAELSGAILRLLVPGLAADQRLMGPVEAWARAIPYYGPASPDRAWPAPGEGTLLGSGTLVPSSGITDLPLEGTIVVNDPGVRGFTLVPWAATAVPSSAYFTVQVTTPDAGGVAGSIVYKTPRYRYRPRILLDERREARATVSGVLRDLYAIDVRREIATVLPEQVAGGGGILSGSCTLHLAEEETVTVTKRGPWDRAEGWPITKHESVEVDVTTVGEPHRVFTGRVEVVTGSARAQEVRAVVRDDARWLDTEVNHQALLAAMPPVNAGVQRQIGLRPDFLVDRVLRQGGFYATPPREAGSVLSVPAQGTLWPEGGAADPATIETSTLVPAWHPAPWGWAFGNVTASYTPSVIGTAGGRLQLTLMAGPDHAEAGFVEVYLTGTPYTVRLTVNADRSVTAALAGSAHTRTWVPPAGWSVVELRLSATGWTLRTDAGGEDAWTVTWPSGAAGKPLGTVRVVAGAQARLGAFQVALPGLTDPAFQAVGYERTATLLVGGLFTDLEATPALEAKDGLALLAELSEAMVASLWVDETGHIFWVHPDRLRDQPPALTLTSTQDLIDLAWEDHADAARTSVTVHALTPNVQDTGGTNVTTQTVSGDVSFAPEQWVLTAAGQSAVDTVLANVSGATPRMVVSGHTDNLPNTTGMTNQELSERRARSVRDYILTKKPAAVVEARGYGDTRPVATNSTAAGRAANRRVEIAYSVIAETEGQHREYAVTVWEGTGDTTNAGDREDLILTPGFREDWIMLAPPVTLTPQADLARFNMGLGSWSGALAAYADGTEVWVDTFGIVSGRLTQIAPATWKLTKTTSNLLSIDAAAVEKVADDARIAPSRRGDNLPVLRAKAKVAWEPVKHTSTTVGPAHHPRLEHDAGPWVHGEASMTALADWIAGQVIDPPAVLRDLPIDYNPTIRLGMVIDVAESAVYQVTLRLLVTGLTVHVEDGSADMAVTGRIVAVVVGGYGTVYELTYPQAQEG